MTAGKRDEDSEIRKINSLFSWIDVGKGSVIKILASFFEVNNFSQGACVTRHVPHTSND
jgi:hypothetical protein